VNLSGDKNQEYFSDGLTEEILNSLARINELQVAARTSAFSFKGKDSDIGTIAHKLNVASILEGSVRRSGHTIRVTAQLNNAVTGFHVWSQTYDRDLGDVLKLQAEIATAVASALKVALLGDEAARIEVGGTRNPAALDAYLRATQTFWGGFSPDAPETAVAGYTEALRLDSDYALAYAARALAIAAKVAFVDTTTSAVRADLDRMQADAAKAIALAPNLSEGFLARAVVYEQLLEFKEASENYERALALAPGNARALRDYGGFAVSTGHSDLGLAAVRRAVVLDPLNSTSHGFLGAALVDLRRYPEALAAFEQAEALLPAANYGPYVWQIGTAYYLLGDYASARAKCEQGRDNFNNQLCLALAYDKLGRHADAEAALKKAQTTMRDLGSYQYAAIYAQWGNRPKALEWLDIAMHRRVPALYNLKTNPLMDPLRQEPRFQVIERELKFPD
jgi:serine/threonine-protein kinase